MKPHTHSELDATTRHRLLADDQRRALIQWLRTSRETEMTLDALASRLQLTKDGTNGTVSGERHVRCRLHHVHLPKLDEAGVLDYDPETKTVRPGRSLSVTATADSD